MICDREERPLSGLFVYMWIMWVHIVTSAHLRAEPSRSSGLHHCRESAVATDYNYNLTHYCRVALQEEVSRTSSNSVLSLT